MAGPKDLACRRECRTNYPGAVLGNAIQFPSPTQPGGYYRIGFTHSLYSGANDGRRIYPQRDDARSHSILARVFGSIRCGADLRLQRGYGFTAQLFPTTLAALYGTRIRASSAIVGLSSGFVVVALFVLGQSSGPCGIHAGIRGLSANVMAIFIASKFNQLEESLSAILSRLTNEFCRWVKDSRL